MRSWWKITKVSVVFLIAILFWIFAIGISINKSGAFYNRDHNAIWIEHAWVGDFKTDEEIKKLVLTLEKHKIDTVFVHTGPLDKNGEVNSDLYKHAINFLDKAKSYNNDIQYQSWLGQIRSKIDLSNQNVRDNITKLSMLLTQIIGFDGIHYDIEPVWDEDLDFIKLLEETDNKLPDEKLISVALAEFIPKSIINFTAPIHEFKNYNSEVNYTNVAKYADQIAVMIYDTSLDTQWLYRSFMQEQTIWLSDLNLDTEIFIGIPAYDDKTEAFDPEIENIFNALHGIINALNNIRSNSNNISGIAIYPYWEMDVHEWRDFYDLWIK